MKYAWPGNVRELAHELERAIVFEDKAQLEFLHLGASPQTNQRAIARMAEPLVPPAGARLFVECRY